MKNRTSRLWSEIVSMVKKSTASMLCACWRKNCRQESPPRLPAGPIPASRRIFRTVVAETVSRSPLIAGDPLVAPARVLSRETEDELADLAADLRPARPTSVCPAAQNQPPVPL